MARGWGSKAIEDQQAEREQAATTQPALSPAAAATVVRRRTLTLARARAVSDLRSARTAAHRTMLEAALVAIDDQLRQLS